MDADIRSTGQETDTFKDGIAVIKGFIFLKSITRVAVANLNAILMRSDMVYIYEVSGNNIVKTLSSAFCVLLARRCEMAISYFYSMFFFLLKLNFRLFVDIKLTWAFSCGHNISSIFHLI